MNYYGRDAGLNHIVARKGKYACGMGLGCLIVDEEYPAFPGDLRNPSAYPYPVQMSIVKGVDAELLIRSPKKDQCLPSILESATELEKYGCRAIVAECGYFGYFQQEVSKHVDIPVFMSSLMQFPLIQQTISRDRTIGIICAEKKYLTDAHLTAVGIDLQSNFILAGARDEYSCPQFENLWNHDLGPAEALYDENERELVEIATDFVSRNKTIRALLLECTGMTPFARAIQRAVDLPVFSWGTLIDYAYSVVVHRDYYGHV
jgi:hypothetical protein